jgi:hypothetical protein
MPREMEVSKLAFEHGWAPGIHNSHYYDNKVSSVCGLGHKLPATAVVSAEHLDGNPPFLCKKCVAWMSARAPIDEGK